MAVLILLHFIHPLDAVFSTILQIWTKGDVCDQNRESGARKAHRSTSFMVMLPFGLTK